MIQYAALLGSIRDGLSDIHHPLGSCLYAIREGSTFLYIGHTVLGEWWRIRQHIRAGSSVGRGVIAYGPAAAAWRVEVCNFGGERGTGVLERELIRRYRPPLNQIHNTSRPRTVIEELELRNRAMFGPACLRVLDAGWPLFCDVPLESLHEYPPGKRAR
jgi:hypothetical protein